MHPVRSAGVMRHPRRGAVAALVLVTAVGGCTAQPTTRAAAAPARAVLTPASTVLVLRPVVRIERLNDEKPLTGVEYGAEALGSSLSTAARGAAIASGATVIDCATATGSAWEPSCAALAAQAAPLARGVVPTAAGGGLAQLSTVQADAVVLASLLVAKVGPAATYNSFSGQITSDPSTALLSAALVGAPAGRVLWRNDALLRTVPEANDTAYQESLRLLFGGAAPGGDR